MSPHPNAKLPDVVGNSETATVPTEKTLKVKKNAAFAVVIFKVNSFSTWEQFYNPDFKVVKFDHFKMQAGLPSFVISVSEWIEKTNAIGIYVKT